MYPLKNCIYFILILVLLISNNTFAQDIKNTEVDSTCYVISQLMGKAIVDGDLESVIIYSNAIDKLSNKFTLNDTCSAYFQDIKDQNPKLNQGIVIFLNSDPQSSPGFSNKIVEHYLDLHNSGLSANDLKDFILLKKIHNGKINANDIKESKLQQLEAFKAEVQSIKIKN